MTLYIILNINFVEKRADNEQRSVTDYPSLLNTHVW